MAYSTYLQSSGWKQRRKVALERSGGMCEKCRKRRATQVHHLTYERIGDEHPSDLQAVCVVCHQKYHPSKRILDDGFILSGELECPACPSMTATIFSDGETLHFMCDKCGHTSKRRIFVPRTLRCRFGCRRRFRFPKDLHRHMLAVHNHNIDR